MKNFEQIEKGFFEVDEDDDSAILGFYYGNKDYFDSIDINDKEVGQKNLWMLSEIINSAYKQKKYELIKMIVKPTIRSFKDYSLKYNYDLKSDTFYKSLIYNVAIDNFENKKYYLATKYFQESVHLDKNNFRFIDFFNESKYRFINKIGRFVGLIGLLLLVIKYFFTLILVVNGLNILIMGYVGAFLLMGFVVIEITIKKPSH